MLWFNDRIREEAEKEWVGKDQSLSIARNMLLIDRPVEEISKVTRLTFEEVMNIKDATQ